MTCTFIFNVLFFLFNMGYLSDPRTSTTTEPEDLFVISPPKTNQAGGLERFLPTTAASNIRTDSSYDDEGGGGSTFLRSSSSSSSSSSIGSPPEEAAAAAPPLPEQNRTPQEDISSRTATGGGVLPPTAPPLPRDVCSAIQMLPTTSSVALWRDNLESIKWSTKHFNDHSFVFHDFNARMMHYLTPQKLQTSVKTLPFNQWDKVGEIAELAYKRYMYMRQVEHGIPPASSSAETPLGAAVPRPVNILIMGGSVTMGVYCVNNPVHQTALKRPSCHWPRRFKEFINGLIRQKKFGTNVFDVYTVALGGTNTRGGTTIWEYKLFPENMPYPDIVINSFSTNDMHVISMEQANISNMTLEDHILAMNQDFIRKVLKPRSSCSEDSPPLLLYLDDYVGNEQKKIMDLTSVNEVLHKLSMYYGFGFMSYADAVRDFVYRNPLEQWFSPSEWPERQIHHGTGGHTAIPWVVSYYLLNVLTTYCDRLNIGQDHSYEPVGGLPKLNDPHGVIPGDPGPRPNRALPPKIDQNLTLDNIAELWWKAHNATPFFNESECPPVTAATTADEMLLKRRSPCYFRMFWNFMPQSMTQSMEPYMVENDGWNESLEEKNGLIPTKSGAMLKLQFKNVTDTIQTLNFVAMKSYGDKWEGSKVKIDAFVDRKGDSSPSSEPLRTIYVEGFHDKKTSESYDYKVDLGESQVQVGDNLRIHMKLIGGSTAKVMGMLLCNS